MSNKNFVWNSERWDGFPFRADDIVISTAPKCGTTWMQMQCALLLFRTPDLPAPLAKLSPWLDMNTRPLAEVVADLEAQTHRRFIKTHSTLDEIPWDERVTYVHVGRDPRDVALSWDDHLVNIDMGRFFEHRIAAVGLDDLGELGIDGPPPELPDDPLERIWAWIDGDSASPSGTGLAGVVRHSESFWAQRDAPNVHLFHYGDQQADLAAEMTRLAAVLGVEPPTEELVEAARFDSMKARADELVPNSDTPFWNSNSQFFSKGRSGEWRSVLGEGGVARYETALRKATDDDGLITWLHEGRISQPMT